MKRLHRRFALLLAGLMTLALLAACSGREEEPPVEQQEESGGQLVNSLEDSQATGLAVSTLITDKLKLVAEKKEINEDAVGWLTVPGTNIDDVVLYRDDGNNKFYERKDLEKNFNFNGVFYADCRSRFGDGTRDQLGSNICIYGHAMTDDKSNSKYDIKFGNLHNFRDKDFARENPYILFSTEKENAVYEIFAVFISNCSNELLPYNTGDLSQEEYYRMVREEVLPRSLYDYNVELDENDKFLTLSTCIYDLPNGEKVTDPDDSFYRYAVMAKRLDDDAERKDQADLTVNDDAVIDPPQRMN